MARINLQNSRVILGVDIGFYTGSMPFGTSNNDEEQTGESIYIHAYTCIYTYKYICTYVSPYIHIHIQICMSITCDRRSPPADRCN